MSEEKNDNMSKYVCTCKKNNCKHITCRGECGCLKCHNNYQDFLSQKE